MQVRTNKDAVGQPAETERGFQMEIYQAALDDLDEIFKIELACFPREAWSRAVFREELVNGRTLYLVARESEESVGYAAVAFDQIVHYAHITSLAVLPGYQRRGIGSALLEKAINQMADRGFHRFRAETRLSNDHVVRLFHKLGFQEEMIINRYYQQPVEAAVILSRSDPDNQSVSGTVSNNDR